MRHRKSGRQLGRNSAHRKAMFRNMVTSLVEHERITTTLAKAKELRGEFDRTITIGKRLGDLLEKSEDSRSQDEKARFAHAVKEVAKTVRTAEGVRKVFSELAPRYKARPGGYTRITKIGRRVGDAAEMAVIELMDRPEPAAESSDSTDA